MWLKIFAGIIAVVLLLTYMVPVVWKLKDVPLACVAALGVGMMLVDLWQSLREKDD
jgi:hypothetical protein